uniref:Uncharacterized protein n=1 Tax=Alexandrium monilatum TaxID=311494 RepID=A0A7S4RDS0_9DINO
MGATGAARAVLEHRGAYLPTLIVLKVLASLAVLFASGTGHLLLVLLGAVATAADIALRIAASQQHAFSLGKHGTDTLLTAVFLVDIAVCGFDVEESKVCRGLRMVLPFVVLTSVGGNLMRLTSAPRRAASERSVAEDEEGGSRLGARE